MVILMKLIKYFLLQRLKAAVHYTVGKICEEMSSDLDVVYDRKFIAVLTEATFKYCQTMATDLELFAKYVKFSFSC